MAKRSKPRPRGTARRLQSGQSGGRYALGLALLLVLGFAGYVAWYSVTHPGR